MSKYQSYSLALRLFILQNDPFQKQDNRRSLAHTAFILTLTEQLNAVTVSV